MPDTPILNLLRDPGHWTKFAMARSNEKHLVSPTTPAATCWCLLGAVQKIAPNDLVRRKQLCAIIAYAIVTEFPSTQRCSADELTCSMFNDAALTTHNDIIRVLTRANV